MTRLSPLSLFIVILMLSACGGGGGGGGSAGVSYTGATSEAVVDTSSGETLATQSYTNGNTGQIIGGVLASVSTPQRTTGDAQPRTIRLTELATAHIRAALEQNAVTTSAYRAVQSFTSNPITGGCGGSASYNISYDDVSGAFSGTFSFNNFCETAQTIDGAISFSGTLLVTGSGNAQTIDFGGMTMTFTTLTVSGGGDSFTADGDLVVATSGASVVITSNMVLRDNNTSKTFMTDDLQLTVTQGAGYEELTYTGRFYHHDYGYVTLSTPSGQALRVVSGDTYPSSGQVVATGTGGSKVTLTALDNTTYQIDVDEGGNGSVELTATGLWGAL